MRPEPAPLDLALGIMERLVTFIIFLLVSLTSYALSITCLKAESEEQRVEWLKESFNNSQIVVQLGQTISTSSSTTKHKVLRI